jgi:ABC-type Fe3+-hydroxamate transport system substrate-binding protein
LYINKLRIRTPREDEDGFDVAQMGTLMHSCFEAFAKKVQGNKNLGVEAFKSIMFDVLDEEYQLFINNPDNEIKEENKITGIYNALNQLGKILNKKELSDLKISELKSQLSQIKVQDVKVPKSVYYVVGFGPGGDFTAPANSHINDIIVHAGGINVGEKLSSWSVSREFLFKENPDLIFVRKEDFEYFTTTYPYSELKAVKNHHTYPIESGWIDVISPRNILAIQEIHNRILEQ